jgi:nucleolar protein 6
VGKGIAFLDLPDSKSYLAALKLHHSLMGGRHINVEPTAGGGGNSSQRKDKIELKKKRLEKVIKASSSEKNAGALKSKVPNRQSSPSSQSKHKLAHQDASK